MSELPLPIAMISGVTPAADWVIVLPLVLCLMGAALSVMLRRSAQLVFITAVLVVMAVMACEVSLLVRVLESGPVSMTMGKWLPPFGISLAADTFGAGFALAASFVTLIVLVYAQGERGAAQDGDNFHALVLLLLGGVTGAFLTADLFNLYVWFEVLLIASFGLMVLGGKPLQLDATIKYGFLNVIATALFLLALGLTYGLLGTLNMADIMRVAPQADPAPMTAISAILLLAFGMKAAAFPLNAWLPASYHTPPAAISALMASLLTKVGIYALLRVLVVILPITNSVLEPVLVVVAAATLMIAPLGAIAETNLRRAIGFMVIGGVGAALAGIAMPSVAGTSGAAFYIVHSMLSMAGLYLIAGLVERQTGQFDTRQMGGIYAANSLLSILFMIAVLAVAGIPPFLGFWPKLLLLQAGVSEGNWHGGLLVVGLLINAVMTLIAGSRLWAHVFLRATPDGVSLPQQLEMRKSRLVYGSTAVLMATVLAVGLWPEPLLAALKLAAPDFLDGSRYVSAIGLAGEMP